MTILELLLLFFGVPAVLLFIRFAAVTAMLRFMGWNREYDGNED